MRWTRRFGTLVVIATASLALPLGTQARGAEPSIFGYGLGASATAVSFIYDQPSFGLPAEHTFELRKVHSVSALDSGPSGRALASILWPGDVVGNAPLGLAIDLFLQDPTSARYLDCSGTDHTCVPVLDQVRNGIDQFKTQYKNNAHQEFNPPPYPIRAESFFPQGPADSEYPAGGGILMTAHADQVLTHAEATTQKAGFPGAFTVGVMNSTSKSGVIGGKAVSEAHALVGDVSLAGGELTIGSVTSFINATSDGTKAKLAGEVKVAGMAIHGKPIYVDGKGMHAPSFNQDPYGDHAAALVKRYLQPNGIDLTIAQPIDLNDGATASRAVSGVIITMSATGMNEMLKNFPDQYRNWLQNPTTSPFCDDQVVPGLGAVSTCNQLSSSIQGFVNSPFQFDQQMQIVLGSVFATSAASPSFDFTLPELPTIPELPAINPPAPAPFVQQPAPVTQPQTPVSPAAPRILAAAPVAALSIPTGFAVLALVAAMLIAFFLRKLALRAVAAEPVETCVEERR